MRKSDYAKMFTLRSDGRYQKKVNGKLIYDRDPYQLYLKVQAASNPTERPKMTFKFAAEGWERQHREEISDRTWNNYKPHYDDLVSKFGSLPICELTPQDVIADLEAAKARGLSATVIKTRKTILSQICNYAIAENEIKLNPVMSAKSPKGMKKGKRTAPTEEEMRTIAQNINAPFGFFPFFLLFTGLRKGEALALTKDDIDLVHRNICVTKSLEYVDNAHPRVKLPKTESGLRTVPIVAPLYSELVIYLGNIHGDILFPSPKSNRNPGGGYMTEKAYEVAWNNYCKGTGLNLTAHQLRHGAATMMFEAGVDPYTAQQILGHADVSTTLGIYTELRTKQKQKSIKKLDREAQKYLK